MPRLQRREDGFSLLELMTVVLIIAILISVAVPAFIGARIRAQDRSAQSDIRNVHTTQKVFFTDNQVFTELAAPLTDIEPEYDYVAGDIPAASGPVYVHVHSTTNGELFVSARSRSGNCFYLRDVPDEGVSYASEDDAPASCPVADTRTYTEGW